MISLVLALSGLSLLGVSSILRRQTAKNVHASQPDNYRQREFGFRDPRLSARAFETNSLLRQQMPALLDTGASPLHQ